MKKFEAMLLIQCAISAHLRTYLKFIENPFHNEWAKDAHEELLEACDVLGLDSETIDKVSRKIHVENKEATI